MPPKVRAAIIEMVGSGVPYNTAASAAGIPERTFWEWMEKGRGPKAREPYRAFVMAVDSAFARWQVSRIELIAASPDARAQQWLLERRNRKEWGDPGRGDVNVQVNTVAIMESQDWKQIRDKVLAAVADYPDALAAVMRELGVGDVIEAGEFKELNAGE